MDRSKPLQPPQYRSLWKTLLPLALLTGFLDITCASIQYYINTGKSPKRVLQYVASGIFGKEAFAGGDSMALYGLLFHFLIAGIFTVSLFLIHPYIYKIVRSRLVLGILYGLVIWCVMNLLVLRLTNIPKLPTFNLRQAAMAALILTVAIGLPVSVVASSFFRKKAPFHSSGGAGVD